MHVVRVHNWISWKRILADEDTAAHLVVQTVEALTHRFVHHGIHDLARGDFADEVATFTGRGMSFGLIPNEDGSSHCSGGRYNSPLQGSTPNLQFPRIQLWSETLPDSRSMNSTPVRLPST